MGEENLAGRVRNLFRRFARGRTLLRHPNWTDADQEEFEQILSRFGEMGCSPKKLDIPETMRREGREYSAFLYGAPLLNSSLGALLALAVEPWVAIPTAAAGLAIPFVYGVVYGRYSGIREYAADLLRQAERADRGLKPWPVRQEIAW